MSFSRVLIVTTLLAALVVSADAQNKPDFSGTWVIVPERSTFGQAELPPTFSLTISHNDPVLKIGNGRAFETYTTDGKPQKNGETTTVGKWEGQAIVLKGTLTKEMMTISIDRRYELSTDGKTLTITRSFVSPDHEDDFVDKIVLTKK